MRYLSKIDSVYDGMTPTEVLRAVIDALRIHCNDEDERAIEWALKLLDCV